MPLLGYPDEKLVNQPSTFQPPRWKTVLGELQCRVVGTPLACDWVAPDTIPTFRWHLEIFPQGNHQRVIPGMHSMLKGCQPTHQNAKRIRVSPCSPEHEDASQGTEEGGVRSNIFVDDAPVVHVSQTYTISKPQRGNNEGNGVRVILCSTTYQVEPSGTTVVAEIFSGVHRLKHESE